MSVTAALVKELREKSGAGMMDCKKALGETGGDMDAAIDWLRTKGLAAAAKKSGRVAAEGLVGISVAGTKGAVVGGWSHVWCSQPCQSGETRVASVSPLKITQRRAL